MWTPTPCELVLEMVRLIKNIYPLFLDNTEKKRGKRITSKPRNNQRLQEIELMQIKFKEIVLRRKKT